MEDFCLEIGASSGDCIFNGMFWQVTVLILIIVLDCDILRNDFLFLFRFLSGGKSGHRKFRLLRFDTNDERYLYYYGTRVTISIFSVRFRCRSNTD